jgi:Tfp pilus assembly protein PilO
MRSTVSIILIIVAVCVFYFGVDPMYQNVKSLQAQAADYNQALSNSSSLRQVRNQLISKYNSFDKGEIDRLEKLLPDSVDNIRLILDINGIASKYGMSIKNISITQAASANTALGTSQNPIGSIQLSFAVVSPYENLQPFLQDLEDSLRLVDVTNLAFSSNDTTDSNNYNITLQTYWLK